MKMRLSLWAEKNFDPPPCRRTLCNWVNDGKIMPAPVFIGRAYYVESTARYIADKLEAPKRPDLKRRLIERIAA